MKRVNNQIRIKYFIFALSIRNCFTRRQHMCV